MVYVLIWEAVLLPECSTGPAEFDTELDGCKFFATRAIHDFSAEFENACVREVGDGYGIEGVRGGGGAGGGNDIDATGWLQSPVEDDKS